MSFPPSSNNVIKCCLLLFHRAWKSLGLFWITKCSRSRQGCWAEGCCSRSCQHLPPPFPGKAKSQFPRWEQLLPAQGSQAWRVGKSCSTIPASPCSHIPLSLQAGAAWSFLLGIGRESCPWCAPSTGSRAPGVLGNFCWEFIQKGSGGTARSCTRGGQNTGIAPVWIQAGIWLETSGFEHLQSSLFPPGGDPSTWRSHWNSSSIPGLLM